MLCTPAKPLSPCIPQVYHAFTNLVERGRRAADKKGDLRERLDEWVAELVEGRRAALEQKEVEEAAAAAQEAAGTADAAAGTADAAAAEEAGVEEGPAGAAEAGVVDGTGGAGQRTEHEGDMDGSVAAEGTSSQADRDMPYAMLTQQQQQGEEEEEEDGIAVMGAQEAESAMGGTPAPAAHGSPAPSDCGDAGADSATAASDVAGALARLSVGESDRRSSAATSTRSGRGVKAGAVGKGSGAAKGSAAGAGPAAGARRGRQARRAVISDSSSSSSSDEDEYEEAMDVAPDSSSGHVAVAAPARAPAAYGHITIKQEPVEVKQEPGSYQAPARKLQAGARRVSTVTAGVTSAGVAAPVVGEGRARRVAAPATLQEDDSSDGDQDGSDEDVTEASTEMESCEDE